MDDSDFGSDDSCGSDYSGGSGSDDTSLLDSGDVADDYEYDSGDDSDDDPGYGSGSGCEDEDAGWDDGSTGHDGSADAPEDATPAAEPATPAAVAPAPTPGQPLITLPAPADPHVTPTATVESFAPVPSASNAVVGGNGLYPSGIAPGAPSHVKLDYVPQQIPRTDGLGPSPASSDPTVLGLRALADQTLTDINTRTITGVSTDRSGPSPVYRGDGTPRSDFGDALGDARGH